MSSSTKTKNKTKLKPKTKSKKIMIKKKKKVKKVVKKQVKDKKIVKSYLGSRGYVLIKKHFDAELIADLKNELYASPYKPGDYGNGDDNEPFPIYMENPNKLYMPRYFGLEHFDTPDEYRVPDGTDINIEFKGNLRPHQLKPVNTCLNAFSGNGEGQRNGSGGGGGIISLGCGQGKTVIALNIIAQVKKRTLVIVNKEFLMNQWIERIQQFLPDAQIGRIQQKKVEIEGKDVVIGMLQSLSMKDYGIGAFDSFGLVVYDECHLVPCRVFSKILLKLNCKRHLGLSATPNRADGMTKVIKMFIGDIIYKNIQRTFCGNILVNRFVIQSDNEHYTKEVMNYRKQPIMATMINNITEFGKRTKIILDILKVLVKEKGEKRQILILSNRRNHLAEMKKFVDTHKIATTGYYIGGMKQKDLKLSEDAQVIFGTFSMADTGLDIKTLNTLILASPKSNIEQSVGRIMRKKHDFVLKIIDIVDDFSVFSNQGRKRMTLYKREMKRYRKEYGEDSFKIKTNIVDEDGFVKDTYFTEPGQRGGRKKKNTIDLKTAGCLFSKN